MGGILFSFEVLPKTRPAGAGIFRVFEVLPKTRPAGAGIFRALRLKLGSVGVGFLPDEKKSPTLRSREW
jgi:hypothetical protein